MKNFLPRKVNLFLLVLAGQILDAPAVWAVQSHGGAEGLVSHQIGHIFFLAGSVSLLWQVVSNNLKGKGWPSFKGFLMLICLWNVLTFTGHWLRESIGSSQFFRQGQQVEAFVVNDVFDLLFYVTSLDHLILFPALFCLALSLSRWTVAS